MDSALVAQKKLIEAFSGVLQTTATRTTANDAVRLFETHISWVVVTGEFAYKFKKAVHFGFVDFSTLEARRFYCNEEVRLNRRLASDIYLCVVTIAGDPEHPVVDGPGEVLEHAVKMHAFAQESLWSYRVPQGLVSFGELEALASVMASFHRDAAVAPDDSEWGTPNSVARNGDETLVSLHPLIGNDSRQQLRALEAWEAQHRQRLDSMFRERKMHGMVRECHGDLHCGNLLTLGKRVEPFDCIEFNDSLRWIDVMNDLAFICMDLAFQRRADLAATLLNLYLEIGGDYAGLRVLRYYEVHRALVRAKVMLLHAAQQDDAQHAEEKRERGLAYLAFAARAIQPRRVALMITHGCSGSGKTRFARSAAELLEAVQVRSDVERKRLHGLSATDRAAADSAVYDAASTQKTYDRLLAIARTILESGRSAIVDAAFLQAKQRTPFQDLAAVLGVPFFIFFVHAPVEIMRQRILQRSMAELDASDAHAGILDHQLRTMEALSAQERTCEIAVDTRSGIDLAGAKILCAPVLKAVDIAHAGTIVGQ